MVPGLRLFNPSGVGRKNTPSTGSPKTGNPWLILLKNATGPPRSTFLLILWGFCLSFTALQRGAAALAVQPKENDEDTGKMPVILMAKMAMLRK
jgi:hypothetical protein